MTEEIVVAEAVLKLEVAIGDTLRITVGDALELRLREDIRLTYGAMSRLAGMIIDCLSCYESAGEDLPSTEAICGMVAWRLTASGDTPLPRADQRRIATAIRSELQRVLLSQENLWLVAV